jgi:hypothetical protein
MSQSLVKQRNANGIGGQADYTNLQEPVFHSFVNYYRCAHARVLHACGRMDDAWPGNKRKCVRYREFVKMGYSRRILRKILLEIEINGTS